MGFNIAHFSKYLRWLRKDRENYRDACLVSKELAKIERRLNFVQLFGKTEKAERLSDEKHDWILRYIEGKCPETLNKYRNMATPSGVGEPNPTLKVWSMWWQGEQNADKLFRMCIDSARRHTHQPVVTLDKDNYRDHF